MSSIQLLRNSEQDVIQASLVIGEPSRQPQPSQQRENDPSPRFELPGNNTNFTQAIRPVQLAAIPEENSSVGQESREPQPVSPPLLTRSASIQIPVVRNLQNSAINHSEISD